MFLKNTLRWEQRREETSNDTNQKERKKFTSTVVKKQLNDKESIEGC